MTYALHAVYKSDVDHPVIVRDHQDLDAVIDEIFTMHLAGNAVFVIAERPLLPPAGLPDHQLLIDAEPGHDVTALYFIGHTASGEVGQWFSLNPTPIEGALELCYDTHTGAEFPPDALIRVDDFRRAMHEFIDNGGVRPECISWQPFRDHWRSADRAVAREDGNE